MEVNMDVEMEVDEPEPPVLQPPPPPPPPKDASVVRKALFVEELYLTTRQQAQVFLSQLETLRLRFFLVYSKPQTSKSHVTLILASHLIFEVQVSMSGHGVTVSEFQQIFSLDLKLY